MICAWSKPKAVLLVASLAATGFIYGQGAQPPDLPNAPGTTQPFAAPKDQSAIDTTVPASEASAGIGTGEVERSKPYLHRNVPPGEGLQPLTAGQKFELSIRSRFSAGAFAGALFGAGWSHLNNSRPHYGSDRGAFGERLGAAELKQASESFFTSGLYAAAFHEDPHYYVMGSGQGHSIAHRAIYAATRVVVTRTDSGGTSVNFAKLAGLASSNALANAYYPVQDRAVSKTVTAFATNLGTSALSLELSEFLPDVFHAIHHKHGD
ncbi:MAG TPA: hypothetical protein VN678_05090 [Acidobacteriaceae bacterium]|nr:hypothetical protein [Acidobacteriaceae bacterium]